jgi:hypothetical protein
MVQGPLVHELASRVRLALAVGVHGDPQEAPPDDPDQWALSVDSSRVPVPPIQKQEEQVAAAA